MNERVQRQRQAHIWNFDTESDEKLLEIHSIIDNQMVVKWYAWDGEDRISEIAEGELIKYQVFDSEEIEVKRTMKREELGLGKDEIPDTIPEISK